jgi:hypothetical protein
MTLPDERYRAIKQARQLLEELCDYKLTPRVAVGIRDRARGALRHYPSEWEMDQVTKLAPTVFQKEMEPLYRMIKQQEIDNGK